MKLIKFEFKDMVGELKVCEKVSGRYRKLAPMVSEDGLWRVSTRLRNCNILPLILPPDHKIIFLIMPESHQFNHAGQA